MREWKKPDLPEGPLRDLNDALHALRKKAGFLSARRLQEMVGKEVCSHTKIHDAFTKPTLPSWGVVELVVEELAKEARPRIDDIEAEVNRFAALWHAAHGEGEASGAAPENGRGRVEGPMDAPVDDLFEDMEGEGNARAAASGNDHVQVEAPNTDLFDQFFGNGSRGVQPKTPENLANEVIQAAYKAYQGWVELDGHDAELSIDPFAPAEELMAEEWLDHELRDRRAYRSDLANLKSALNNLVLYHTILLPEHPSREELASVMERARQFRDWMVSRKRLGHAD
ncbi:hypothetical protein [Streptomyces sp. CNQ085]|uniref:hypothetical protein n=1 Tax=Streptomyces sp. CNQ085 TaxID=2886944 RepID=UPI001F50E056|nr:hypothetical protein [Streptomyces sp. CNQ085]MCI0383648.1 hypothetical protein [Streptomyces sp. CNQ085]